MHIIKKSIFFVFHFFCAKVFSSESANFVDHGASVQNRKNVFLFFWGWLIDRERLYLLYRQKKKFFFFAILSLFSSSSLLSMTMKLSMSKTQKLRSSLKEKVKMMIPVVCWVPLNQRCVTLLPASHTRKINYLKILIIIWSVSFSSCNSHIS